MPKGKGAAAAFEEDVREASKKTSENDTLPDLSAGGRGGTRLTKASGRLDYGDELERVNITLPTKVLHAADQEVLRRKVQGQRVASRSRLIQEALEQLLTRVEV